MLTVEEALLFQAVKDEQARQEAMQQATTAGAVGGAALGAGIGAVPHTVGKAINRMRPKHTPNRFKPGTRLAGGLTGMILGGGLGAGTAAVMKQESDAAKLLGKIQAQRGELDEFDQRVLGELLGEIYNQPSQFM